MFSIYEEKIRESTVVSLNNSAFASFFFIEKQKYRL